MIWVSHILVYMYFEAFIFNLNCFAFSCTYKEMANECHERIKPAHRIEYTAFHPSCKLGLHRNGELADFSARKSYVFQHQWRGQRGPEKEKKWKHSPGITYPKTREESDYFSIWSFSADLLEKKFSVIVDKEWFIDGHEKVLLICDFLATNMVSEHLK